MKGHTIMDFTTLTTMATRDEIEAALALDFSAMDDDALTAALTERRAEATRLFSLESASPTDADIAEALVASIDAIEGEQTERQRAAQAAAERFAAARAQFTAGAEESEEDTEEDGEETEESEEEDTEDESTEDESEEDSEDGEDGEDGEAAVTAAARAARTRKVPVARRVATKTKRPAVAAEPPVTITASANIPGFNLGAKMNGMTDVATAAMGVARNFAPYDARRAEALRSQGINEQLVKVSTAQFALQPTNGLKSKSGVDAEYNAMKEAVTEHVGRIKASLDAATRGDHAALAAAMAWCSPSEVVYNWIADFTVDGLLDLPEISAPRGGLMLTEGPRLAQDSYQAVMDDPVEGFGFGGTEAEMEAGYIKTCETIECPEFVDHRLDFDGYCWKIPILTESTFPELVADAMRVSDLLYAHKINRRKILDILAESTARDATDLYGGSVMDTIEALVQVATKERRWWNVGENAVMEVKVPQFARDVFKIDMQRRSGLALSDVATEQKVNALFAAYNLSVKYLSDFDEITTAAHPTTGWGRNDIRAIMYPAGTFVVAQKDVITLSTVHDAASLSENEYTGVFYEQGLKVIRRGYRSTVVSVPICTAGATGGNVFTCDNFGSF